MDYTEQFDFDYDGHDFIESQVLLNSLIEAGEVHRSEATRFLGSRIFGYQSPLGLSTSHIFAQHHDKTTPKAGFWKGAGLIDCRRQKVQMGESEGKGSSKRGKIQEFSGKSRRRLMQTVAKLRRTELPMFITLTYPGEFSVDPTRWKKDLKNFVERMGRKFPGVAILWRLEPQKRGAPHYHLLVWGLPTRIMGTAFGELIQWVSFTWFQVVGSGDIKHLQAGTRVERVRSQKGVAFYAAKYLSKVDLAPWEGLDIGRFWGIYFRERMPWGDYVEVTLTDKEAINLIRIMRKKARLRGFSGRNLSIFALADFWYERLRDILGQGMGVAVA